MIKHNDPCGGVIVYDVYGTGKKVLPRGARSLEEMRAAGRDDPRILFCTGCGEYWPDKRAMWQECHPEPDA